MASPANTKMTLATEAPRPGEPYLLTPGPLTTARSVKEEMLRDWGSWDSDFRELTARLRSELLALAGDPKGEFECVPMQGSGTFVVEAMLGSLIPRSGRTLVLSNGAYGKRIAETLSRIGRDHAVIDKGDYLPPRGREVAARLEEDPSITHVVAVHCETSSGILNPVAEISEATYAAGRKLLVDSMSAFGAVPLAAADIRYEALVSSANKCIEGVPGFGFVIVRRQELEQATGNCHSLSLDIHDQWAAMERTGQWRYTPPTHVVAAFLEALRLHREEGGVAGRGARYTDNRDTLVAGMRGLGFETLLTDEWLSPIIVTFFNPGDPKFDFGRFYGLMKESGFIIYPGKLTVAESFRVGCIGRIDRRVMEGVVEAAASALGKMGVAGAAPPEASIRERAKLAEKELSGAAAGGS